MSSCPHCGGLLARDYDGYEQYYTCLMCGRSFDMGGNAIRKTPIELEETMGIKLIMGRGRSR